MTHVDFCFSKKNLSWAHDNYFGYNQDYFFFVSVECKWEYIPLDKFSDDKIYVSSLLDIFAVSLYFCVNMSIFLL